VTRPTFAPANWSFSSALIMNSVFAGVMPSAARRWKKVLNALSYACRAATEQASPGPSALPGEVQPVAPDFLSCVSEM
jgi:hypothetical protein